MEHLPAVLTILFITFMGIVSPGPNFFLVVSKSLSKTRKNGIVASAGVSLGSLIYSAAGFLGVAAVVSSSDTAYGFLRLFGGSFLIYTGIKMLIKKRRGKLDNLENDKRDESLLKSFITGLSTNLSNPKAMVIYISIFSISAEPMPLFYRVLTCLLIFLTAFLWYSFVAVSFSNKKMQAFYDKRNRVLSGFFGTVIAAFGLKIIFNGK